MIAGSADRDVTEVMELLPPLRRVLRLRVPQGYGPSDLSPAQLQLLVELASSGSQPMSELAARLGVSFSTTTELVGKLVRGGKVTRTKSERDRRQTLVQVTPEADALAAAVTEDRRTRVKRALESLSETERAAAIPVLRQLQQALG